MSEEEYFTEEELEEISDSYAELKEKLEELLIDNEDVAETFFDGNAELANEKICRLASVCYKPLLVLLLINSYC